MPNLDELAAKCGVGVYSALPRDVGFVLVLFDALSSASVHSEPRTREAIAAVGNWLTQVEREETQ